ncbi:hypothetical protein MF672_038080 [Actinomadura sp. ATCC 31491]|uniref:Uncharacterized protein n=1 Tax=Actinomadura luzonensis TaxID=2805427 RepID=A0ABT0G4R6_9ACTN|nr:hypothetical protein [Actinomadura luzonensis]MCK2219562.1 hypothetical protein [Actinomadura luzonensis]
MTRNDPKALVTAPDLAAALRAPQPRRTDCDIDGFYLWDVHGSRSEGPCGVTSRRDIATAHLLTALIATTTGTGDVEGLVRRVWLDRLAKEPRYIRGRVVIRVRRDRRTGEIVLVGER